MHLPPQLLRFAVTSAVLCGPIIFPLSALAVDHTLPAIDNFDRITPSLYRGSAPCPDEVSALKELGVRTIIDFRMRHSHAEERAAEQAGIEYIHMPLGYWSPSKASIDKALSVLTDPNRGSIYMHCRQGADRTGTIAAIYRIVVQKWSFARAYQEMRAHHFKPWWFALRERVETIAQQESVPDVAIAHR
jgi:protein tyrosine/serine phosphatase